VRAGTAGSTFDSALTCVVAVDTAAASGAGLVAGSATGATSAAGSGLGAVLADGAAAGSDGTTTARTVLPRCRRCFSSRFCSFAARAAALFSAFRFFLSSSWTAASTPTAASAATASP